MRPLFRVPAFIVLAALLVACGRKGPPSLPVYEPLNAPSQLSAVHREGRVYLKWAHEAPENAPAPEFALLRATGVGAEADSIARMTATKYIDSEAALGATYVYEVLALPTGRWARSNSAKLAVTLKDVPPAPAGLKINITGWGVRLAWDGPAQGQGQKILYNVYRTSAGGGGADTLRPINPEPLLAAEFNDNPYMGEGPVFYTVRAQLGGPLRHEGPASAEISLRPGDFIPRPPVTVRAVLTGGKVLLSWTPSTETWVRGYTVLRALDGGELVPIGQSRTPAYVDFNPVGGAMTYRVRAIGPEAEGPLSVPVTLDNRAK